MYIFCVNIGTDSVEHYITDFWSCKIVSELCFCFGTQIHQNFDRMTHWKIFFDHHLMSTAVCAHPKCVMPKNSLVEMFKHWKWLEMTSGTKMTFQHLWYLVVILSQFWLRIRHCDECNPAYCVMCVSVCWARKRKRPGGKEWGKKKKSK